jgi:hypothetical protein
MAADVIGGTHKPVGTSLAFLSQRSVWAQVLTAITQRILFVRALSAPVSFITSR